MPKTTTAQRSTRSSSRRATLAPRKPPASAAGATIPTATQSTGPKSPNATHRDARHHQRQHRLEPVEPAQAVPHGQREHAEQDHPERAAEVAAVHRGHPDRRVENLRVGPVVGARRTDRTRHSRLDGEQQAGREHQEWDDRVEGARRGGEQQDAADDRAEHGGHRQARHPPALAGQLRPEAEHAADVPGPQRDRVGDVRGERAVAGGHQRREEDQRPAAGHGVDAAGQQSGAGQQECVGDLHGGILVLRRTSRPGGRVGVRAPRRGTSGLHRAGWLATPTRGDPRDSATENRPPRRSRPVRVKRWCKRPPAPGVTRAAR